MLDFKVLNMSYDHKESTIMSSCRRNQNYISETCNEPPCWCNCWFEVKL